jgi:PmbA protein
VPDTSQSKGSLAQAAEQAVAYALKAGAQSADALVESGRNFRVDVLAGNIENLKQAQARGLGLRVFVDQKPALVYSSDLRPEALKDLAGRAVNLARKSTVDPFAGLPGGPPSMVPNADKLGLYDPAVAALTAEQKISLAKELEKAALGYDKRIVRTDGCSMTTNLGDTYLASSAGPTLNYRGTAVGMFVNPLADDGPRQQSGNYGEFQRVFAKLRSPEEIGKEAGKRAVDRIGARGVPTQKVPVVMHPDISGNWIQNMFQAFQGDEVFKKTSYLTEKLGQKVGSDIVTLIDDGPMPQGVGTAPFDGEGMPTQKNVLIENGMLKMFVYNAYWGRKAKAKSTGNANRGYQNAPAIGPRNLYIAAGTTSKDDILKSIDRGFYMVDQGAFGYNAATGAYSYQAAGYWIEKGERVFPVDQITVASATLDMLNNIVMVGSDLEFNGNVNAPTLKIAEMTVSGRPSAG